jgi:hypothetical protein
MKKGVKVSGKGRKRESKGGEGKDRRRDVKQRMEGGVA